MNDCGPHQGLIQHRAFEGATTVWQAGAAAWREVIALEQSLAEQAIQLGELGDKVTDEVLEKDGMFQQIKRIVQTGRSTFFCPVCQK